MDFIDWCDHLLATLVRMEKHSNATRQMGVSFHEFLQDLVEGEVDQQLTDAAVLAERELRSMGMIEQGSSVQRIRPSRRGKLHVQDPTRTWKEICAIEVDDEESRLIQATNARSPRSMPSHATVERVTYDELDLPDVDTLPMITRQLEQDYYLIAGARSIGDKTVRSTYPGLVWETRKRVLGASRQIDQMDVDLLPEQQELLVAMVEAARRQPRERRSPFIFGQTFEGAFLLHNEFPGRELQIYSGDFVALRNAGLVDHINQQAYDVSPLGHRYYEQLKNQSGQSAATHDSQFESSRSLGKSGESNSPHIFISYVREDVDEVARLHSKLEDAGVTVWIDRKGIGAGQRWKAAIRQAIRSGAFFIAVFSANYQARPKTYMNEELTIAIEELRQRPTDHTWFIPVLITACDVPDRDIGAGETLRDLQQVRLHEDWDRGVEEILKAVS